MADYIIKPDNKKTVVGIDVGGSTTKIVGFQSGEMIAPQFVKASDPLTSLFGAFGKFTAENNIELPDIEKIILTGVGSSFVKHDLRDAVRVLKNELVAFG